ncbi:MAG: hypothetical protein ACF8XB_10460 [Planctomycetota bacterium JB042]
MGGTPDVDALKRSLKSDDRNERACAVLALAERGGEGVRELVTAAKGDDDDLVATAAALACWRMGEKGVSWDRAIDALLSDDDDAVVAAVEALQEAGDAAVGALGERVNKSGSSGVKVVRMLGEIGGERARKVVEELAGSGEEEVTAAARKELEEWDDGEE